MDWPAGMQPAGSFSHKEDCVGRAAIVPLVQNEVILDQEVAKPGEGAGLPVTIPAGMRAVSVGVDDVVAVAGFVTPGTVVERLDAAFAIVLGMTFEAAAFAYRLWRSFRAASSRRSPRGPRTLSCTVARQRLIGICGEPAASRKNRPDPSQP